MTQGARLYRSVALESSTHLDLVIGVYDAIAADLHQCAIAVSACDISARCQASDRAMLLVGHLENWLEFLNEKPLQDSLGQFYGYLRAEILRLQTTTQPQGFLDLALRVSETRAAWQKRFAAPPANPEVLRPVHSATQERVSWTA